MSKLTFDQFQMTRTACDDIAAVTGIDMGTDKPVKGFLYCGTCYIDFVDETWPEDCQAQGSYHLLIERSEYISNDREKLERILYDWAVMSGYEANTDELVTGYATWNAEQGLKLGSADEHYFDEDLTESQRRWLREFGRVWDEVQEREHEAWRKENSK